MKIILYAVALLMAGAYCGYAQTPWQAIFSPVSKADASFMMNSFFINHRHTGWLGEGNRMTIELERIEQYSYLGDLERILADVAEDISFLKDSISKCPQCNYRLDYAATEKDVRIYRLRRYEPKGVFLYQRGMAMARPYKPESDTLHLLLRSGDTTVPGSALRFQVRFVLNRLSNFDSLLAQKGKINALADTFRRVSQPVRKVDRNYSAHYRTSVVASPHWRTGATTVSFTPNLPFTDDGIQRFGPVTPAFDGQAHVGAGFLADRVAPTAGIGLIYRLPRTRHSTDRTIVGFYASGYFAFTGNDEGSMTLHDNYFLNLEAGNETPGSADGPLVQTQRTTTGIGYLISGKGPYYRGTTMKLFVNFRHFSGITISPEIIFTDNFRRIFPGITLKFL